MNTEMKMERRKLAELRPADYNPRKALTPADKEYQDIKRRVTSNWLTTAPVEQTATQLWPLIRITSFTPDLLKERLTPKIIPETRFGRRHGTCTAMAGRTASDSLEKELIFPDLLIHPERSRQLLSRQQPRRKELAIRLNLHL